MRWQFCCCHFSIWCSFEALCYFPQDFINRFRKCLFLHDTTLKVLTQISKKIHRNESSMNQKTHLPLVRIIEAVKEWVGSILGIQWRDLTRVSSWWTSYQNIGQNPRVSLTIQSPHQDQKKIQVAFSSSKPKTFDICFHHFHHCTADGVFYTKLSLSKIGSFFLDNDLSKNILLLNGRTPLPPTWAITSPAAQRTPVCNIWDLQGYLSTSRE